MSDYIIDLETRQKLDNARYTLKLSAESADTAANKILVHLAVQMADNVSRCCFTTDQLPVEDEEEETVAVTSGRDSSENVQESGLANDPFTTQDEEDVEEVDLSGTVGSD